MIDPRKLPAFVRNDVIESLTFNNTIIKTDAEAEQAISRMTPRDVFDIYLNWIGLHGFTDKLIAAMDGIRAADVK